uniref:AraC family transcriptional regulator n=1 Tax=uncultured Draconibacterium sp. TaxID=1573823 RepID=UPI003217DD10
MKSEFQNILTKDVTNDEIFKLEIFRVISFKPGFHYKMHSHDRIELNYVLKGSCVMMFENKLVKLNQHNSILIFPGFEHDFYVDSKQGIKIVQLEFLLNESAFDYCRKSKESELSFLFNLKSRSNSFLKIPNNPEIGNCMERIIKENKLKRTSYVSLSELYLLELIYLLSRVVSRQNQPIGSSENEYLKVAMSRIHSNYSTGVSVSDLARECKISERYLRTLFNKYLESTPQEYCNNLRVNKSIELLADRHIPIKEIAYRVGYSTPQYFSRMFKEKYGFSPQTYRKILF